MTTVCFDVETTTLHKGHPFTASNKLVSYSVKRNDSPATFHYYDAIDFMAALRSAFAEARLLVTFNGKFDLHWAHRKCVVPRDGVRIWDCQLAEFIINGQKGAYPSLNDTLAKYGLGQKVDKIAEYWALGIDTPDIPMLELQVYNNFDVDLTYKLYLKQQEVMSEKQKMLCMLMGLDLLVLQEMERNGIRFDKEKCEEKAEVTGAKLDAVTQELLTYAPTPLMNLNSGHQLSCMLYGGAFEVTTVDRTETMVYKSGKRKGEEYVKSFYRTDVFHCDPLFKPLPRTQTKNTSKVGEIEYPIYQSGEDVLKQLRATSKKQKTVIDLLLKRAEYAKLMDTYYAALPILMEDMEWEDGCIHGQYNQCVAGTGRLSSSKPNMQNFSSEVDELLVSRYDQDSIGEG